MEFTIDIGDVLSAGRSLIAKAATIEKAAGTVVAKAAYDVEKDAKNLVAVDTGATKNSIGTDIDGLTATVGPTTEYAPFLEDGTSRMGPQPFMGPAFDRNLPKFERAMAVLGGRFLGGK